MKQSYGEKINFLMEDIRKTVYKTFKDLEKEQLSEATVPAIYQGVNSTSPIQSENRWIPLSKKIPERGKQVLCCNKQGFIFASAVTYVNSDGEAVFGQHHGVVAWMPLPEPYKVENEE